MNIEVFLVDSGRLEEFCLSLIFRVNHRFGFNAIKQQINFYKGFHQKQELFTACKLQVGDRYFRWSTF